jgi:glyoxylase I family protein
MDIRFHHIAISTEDCARSFHFYEQLGFQLAYRWEAPDKSLEILHLALGRVILEVFCYQDSVGSDQTVRSLEIDLKVRGVRHFGICVANITDAYQYFVSQGLKPLTVIQTGRTGIFYFFLRDPDGTYVEIVQDDRQLGQSDESQEKEN